MVLEGQFVFFDRQLWRVLPAEKPGAPPRFEPASRQDVADATRQLFQLSADGITLVEVENGRARHTIHDLARQNAGNAQSLDRRPAEGEDPTRAMLKNVEDCYRDGDSLRRLFVRPNQVFLANANRVDVLFKAPLDAAGKMYTVFAQEVPAGDGQLPATAAGGRRQRPSWIQSSQPIAGGRRRGLRQGWRRRRARAATST